MAGFAPRVGSKPLLCHQWFRQSHFGFPFKARRILPAASPDLNRKELFLGPEDLLVRFAATPASIQSFSSDAFQVVIFGSNFYWIAMCMSLKPPSSHPMLERAHPFCCHP